MKRFSVLLSKIFMYSLFLLASCSSDYQLDLGDGYYLIKLDSTDHSIIKKGGLFFNYRKKNIDFGACLSRDHKENCYGYSSDTIIEPDIEELGVTDEFIIGRRREAVPSSLDKNLIEELVSLQDAGYFLINKKLKTIEAGMQQDIFINKINTLRIDKDVISNIDDRKNSFKAFPQMILDSFYGKFPGVK